MIIIGKSIGLVSSLSSTLCNNLKLENMIQPHEVKTYETKGPYTKDDEPAVVRDIKLINRSVWGNNLIPNYKKKWELSPRKKTTLIQGKRRKLGRQNPHSKYAK